MGLFNLGKKKDIPMPSKPDFSEPSPPESEQPQSSEPVEQINFDELSDITPPPSPESPPINIKAPANNHEIEDFTAEPAPLKPEQPSSQPVPKKEFELPDFLDEEMRALREAKAMMKEAEKKPEPAKPIPPPEQPKPKITVIPEQQEDFTKFAEPANQKIAIEKPFLAEQTKKPALPAKEPFMDINKYLELKNDFEDIRKLMLAAQDMIEEDAILGREKSDKYQTIAESLNFLQEKLMLIDTKLFED